MLLITALLICTCAQPSSIDLQFSAWTTAGFFLSYLLPGNDLTYSISGNYTTAEGSVLEAPPPFLSQRLSAPIVQEKPAAYSSNAQVGFVADPSAPGIYFDAGGSTVFAWNLTSLELIGSIENNLEIVSLCSWFSGMSTVLSTVGRSGSKATLQIIEVNYSAEFSAQIVFTQPLPFLPADSLCENAEGDARIYLWGEGQLSVYYYVVGTTDIILVRTMTAADIGIVTFSPVEFGFMYSYGLICDAKEGVILFDLDAWLQGEKHLIITQHWLDPTYYGQLLGCFLGDGFLYVSAERGQIAYTVQLADFKGLVIVLLYSQRSDQLKGSYTEVSGLLANSELMASVLYYQHGSPSLRIVANSNHYGSLGLVIAEEELCELVSCGTGQALAFIVLPSSDYSATLIIDSENSLYSFKIFLSCILTFEPVLASSYVFSGIVTVSDSQPILEIPLTAIGWNPSEIHIYPSRNSMSIDGYAAPTSFTHNLNSGDGLKTVIYLPLSNYFSGHAITYDLTLTSDLLQDYSDCAQPVVSMSYPPLLTFTGSIEVQAASNSPTLQVLQYSNYTLLALVAGNRIVLFDAVSDEEITILNVVLPTNAAATVTQCAVVIELFSSSAFLVVESHATAASALADYFWDIFDVTDPLTPQYMSTVTFLQTSAFGKLQGRDSYLYSLRSDGIYVLCVKRNPDDCERTPYISQETVGMAEFTPIDFSIDFLQNFTIVYEEHAGLMLLQPEHDGFYSVKKSGVPLAANPRGVRLLQYDSVVLLLDSSSGSATEYSVPDLQPVRQYPRMQQSTYAAAQATFARVGITGTLQGVPSFFIFSQNALEFRSLLTVIPDSPALAIVSTVVDEYRVYAYSEGNLTQWRLGQSEADWSPQSDWVPQRNPEPTVWAKVQFRFACFIDHIPPQNFTATIGITARTKLDPALVDYASVEIILENTGSYIRNNLDFSAESPLPSWNRELVIVNESVSSLQTEVIDEYFLGGDATLAFIVNGNAYTPLKSLYNCSSESALICISAKQSYCGVCLQRPQLQNIYDFDVLGTGTYFATDDGVLGQTKLGEQMFNITTMRGMKGSICYVLETVHNSANLLAVVCTEWSGQYSGIVLALLNVSNPNATAFFDLSSAVLAIDAIADSDSVHLFVCGISRILVLSLVDESLVLLSVISADSLSLTQFFPASVASFNHSYLLVADQLAGAMVLHASDQGFDYTLWQIAPDFQCKNDTCAVAVAVSPDGESAFVLSTETALYQYSLWDAGSLNLSLVTVVPPLSEDLDQFLLYDVLRVDSTGTRVIFPVYDGAFSRLRMVNMTAPAVSRIYTSTDPVITGHPPFYSPFGNVIITAQDSASLNLSVVLAYGVNDTVLKSFSIRYHTTAYLFPQSTSVASNQLVRLQLAALNSLSTATGDVFHVLFNSSHSADEITVTESSKATKLYQQWWLWTVIGIAALILFTVIALIVLKRQSRKRPPQNVELTEESLFTR